MFPVRPVGQQGASKARAKGETPVRASEGISILASLILNAANGQAARNAAAKPLRQDCTGLPPFSMIVSRHLGPAPSTVVFLLREAVWNGHRTLSFGIFSQLVRYVRLRLAGLARRQVNVQQECFDSCFQFIALSVK